MTLDHVQLFEGISDESIDAMIHCFKPETQKVQKRGHHSGYSQELEYLCVLMTGKAHLYCVDSEGEDIRCWSITVPTTSSARFSPCPTADWAMWWRQTPTAR
jgi:hypothetical protein